MTPRKHPAKKKTSPQLKNTPRLPASKKGRTKRARKIDRHVRTLYGTAYCPALKSNVAFKKYPTRSEMSHQASRNKDSTLFALNIEQLLKTATLDHIDKAKPNTNSQHEFDEMYILKQYIKRHGTAKITVGHYKEKLSRSAPYCQYAVTRCNLRKGKVKIKETTKKGHRS